MPSWRIPGDEVVRLAAAALPGLLLLLVVAGLVGAGGCTNRIPGEPISNGRLATDRALVAGYFVAVNAAAHRGSAVQELMFSDTQHPDFRDRRCSLRGLTVTADPAYSTLHGDPEWLPPGLTDPPRGTIYVVAATITVEQDTTVLATQIGSLHVVVLDDTAYGFAPCPA